MHRFALVKNVTIVAILSAILSASLPGHECADDPTDCNENGEPDACELGGEVQFHAAERFALGATCCSSDDASLLFDADADGDLDYFSGAIHSLQLDLYRNDAGRMEPERAFSTNHRVYELRAAMLDYSPLPDVIVAGIIELAVIIDPAADDSRVVPVATVNSGYWRGVDAGDLDGDGDSDLVASLERLSFANRIETFWNRGDGSFDPGAAMPLADGDLRPETLGDPSSIVVFDADGDPLPDVAVLLSDRADLLIYFNEGSREFSLPLRLDTERYPSRIVVCDIDADGDQDLIVGNSNRGLLLTLFENGNDRESFVAHSIESPGATEMFGVADVSLDGRSDIVGAGDGGLAVLRNLGRSPGGSVSFDHPRWVTAASPRHIVLGDVDGDGATDLVTAEPDVRVLYNRTPIPAARDCNQNGILDDCELSTGDCDGNGVPDDCDPDCDRDGVPDACEIAAGAEDCDLNGVPDDCDPDCDGNGVADSCDLLLSSDLDCNANNHLDACDITTGLSRDVDQDGQPDECQRPFFRRGDINVDGSVDISDAGRLFGWLFLGAGELLACVESADTDNDGVVLLTDGILLLNYLFLGGPPPHAPFDEGGTCGQDDDPPGGPGDLGCTRFEICVPI